MSSHSPGRFLLEGEGYIYERDDKSIESALIESSSSLSSSRLISSTSSSSKTGVPITEKKFSYTYLKAKKKTKASNIFIPLLTIKIFL